MLDFKRNLKLNELYRELSKVPNSDSSFIANVIFTSYGRNRKKMLQGLYNIINGGPRHYWSKCYVRFAPFQMRTIIATELDKDDIPESDREREHQVDLDNLVRYA
tara:strand:- start:346 stop:660 length:315 start_codon:yes stop_codon:yes gene_type:complete